METITTSPAGVTLADITVLVGVPNGLPTDEVLLFEEGVYLGVPMTFVDQTGQIRNYSCEYTLPNPVMATARDVVFRVRVKRDGLLGPLSNPFVVTYVPPLATPEFTGFEGTPPAVQPT